MQGSEALALVAELQAAFGKQLSQDTKNAWIRELDPYALTDGQTAVRNIIRTEERFPAIAVVLRYVAEERKLQGDRALTPEELRKALAGLRADAAHLANLREESFTDTLRGHLAMCRENLGLAGDDSEERAAWEQRIEWCEELLAKGAA
jgi:hypothetical protein